MTPAAKQIATRCITVKPLSRTFKSLSIMFDPTLSSETG
jgi:hypothetical protein